MNLDRIRIVLVNPSHPGNIGATARAMKNMGLSALYLVDPAQFPDPQAQARASGADDILEQAVVVEDLTAALVDCEQVFATSARVRSLSWPMLTPRQCAQEVHSDQWQQVAVVFGREQAGLTNEELSLCHQQIHIPTNEAFSSLNLAQAVQVLCYELRVASLSASSVPTPLPRDLASQTQMSGFYQHLSKVLTDIHFLDPKQPRMLMQRLQRLFNRAAVDRTELNILRGILSAIERLSD